MDASQIDRIEAWVRAACTPFVGRPLSGDARQGILFAAKTALGVGTQNFPEMAEVRVTVAETADGGFSVRALAPDEDAPPDALLIDMTTGVTAVDLQARINYVYAAVVNAVATMTPRDRAEILLGVAACMAQYWPAEWNRIKNEP